MLTSKDNVKQYLAIESLGTEYDSIIDVFCSSATNLIENHIGNPIELQEVEYEFQLDYYSKTKTLPFTKVNSIVSLSVMDNIDYEYTLLTDYATLIGNPYRLMAFTGFHPNYQYKAVLSVGYAVIPDMLVQSATEIASIMFKESDVNSGKMEGRLGIKNMVVSSGTGGVSNIAYESVWEKWKRELQRYKIIGVGRA